MIDFHKMVVLTSGPVRTTDVSPLAMARHVSKPGHFFDVRLRNPGLQFLLYGESKVHLIDFRELVEYFLAHA